MYLEQRLSLKEYTYVRYVFFTYFNPLSKTFLWGFFFFGIIWKEKCKLQTIFKGVFDSLHRFATITGTCCMILFDKV